MFLSLSQTIKLILNEWGKESLPPNIFLFLSLLLKYSTQNRFVFTFSCSWFLPPLSLSLSLFLSLLVYLTFCFGLLHLVRALFSALGTVCLHVFVRHGLYIVRRYDKTILISIVRNKSWVLGFQVIGGYTFILPFQVYWFYIDLCTFIVGESNEICISEYISIYTKIRLQNLCSKFKS